jgi:hypothetical protein
MERYDRREANPVDCVRMVHFMRNALAQVPKGAQQMVAATIRTVFFQPDAESARATWRKVADGFRPRWSRLAEVLDAAEDEVLTYLAFPRSTGARYGAITRRNGSIKRSSVGRTWSESFPTSAPSSVSSAASWPSNTTSGPSLVVTSQPSHWRSSRRLIHTTSCQLQDCWRR